MAKLTRLSMDIAPRLDTAVARTMPKTADRFYASPEWQQLRTACLKRDGYKCTVCGQPGRFADHIVSRRNGGEDKLSNLRTLCRNCDNRLKEDHTGQRRGGKTGVSCG